MLKRLHTRVNHRWFTFDVYVDENFRTHAHFIGYTSQTPMKYRDVLRVLAMHGIEGVTKIDPRDSFDYRIGKAYAINRAVQKIQLTIAKVMASVDKLWCDLFKTLNDSTS